MAVIVLRYPNTHWQGNCGIFRTGIPGLYFDSGKEIVWKCTRNESISVLRENPWFEPLMIYERSAGQAQLEGWMKPGFDDSVWEAPRY